MNILAAWFTLFLYLAFASTRWRALLHRLVARIGDWSVALLLAPYLLAVDLRPAPSDLLRFSLYLALPTLLLRRRSGGARPMDGFHILTVLAIWLPLEPSLFALAFSWIPGVNAGAWLGALALPGVSASLVSGAALPIEKLTGVLLALHLFLILHPLSEIGFSFRFRAKDVGYALVGLVVFAVAGIPLGLGIGFLRIQPRIHDPATLATMIIGGYLLIALAEEVLFRGIIQNLLGKRWRHPMAALVVAAIIFGASHLNNATLGFPEPNWGYMVMATLAGLTYGWVWWKTGRVTASAITHMLVNLLWGIVLGG